MEVNNLFTKKETALILNCSTKELAVYIKRGKMAYTASGEVDLSVDKHIAFVQLKRGKDGMETPEDLRSLLPKVGVEVKRGRPATGRKPPPPKKERQAKPQKPAPLKKKEDLVVDETSFDDEDENLPQLAPTEPDWNGMVGADGKPLLSLAQSEQKKKHHDAYLAELNSEIAQLKRDKMAGMVVPTSLIAPIFSQHNHAILTNFSNGIEEILRKFGKIADLTSEEQASMKGEATAALNAAMQGAISTSERLVDRAINDFVETKK